MRSTHKHPKKQQVILEAVARQLSARWKDGDAYLTVAGKRVALDVTSFKSNSRASTSARHGLRFDKVATWLIESLRSSLEQTVPDGMTVLLAVTAPIRLPSKTVTDLEETIPALLAKSPDRDRKQNIHGNRVQVRFLRDEFGRAPKLIGFVHNPDSDPRLFFDMTAELLQLIANGGAESRSFRA